MSRLPSPAVPVVAYLIGGIPFSGALARVLRGTDLRTTGSGTVSGTGLYRLAGWRPLVIGGILDVLKGSIGPLLAGSTRPALRAVACGASVTGHNWSPYLGGAGGRGLSPALGALLPVAPEGSALLLGGLAVGKLAGATSVGALAADLALVPWLARRRGRQAASAAAAVVVPMLIKRVAGNAPPPAQDRAVVCLSRLVFDQDHPPWRAAGSG